MAEINGLVLKMAVSDAARQLVKTLPLSLCIALSQLHLPLHNFIVSFDLNKRKSIPMSIQLTDKERYQGASLKQAGISISAIARQIKRSRTLVTAFLKDPSTYMTHNFRSDRRKLTIRDQGRMLRAASN